MRKLQLKIYLLVALSLALSACSSVPQNYKYGALESIGLKEKLDLANEAYSEARLGRAETLYIEITQQSF